MCNRNIKTNGSGVLSTLFHGLLMRSMIDKDGSGGRKAKYVLWSIRAWLWNRRSGVNKVSTRVHPAAIT